MLLLPTLAARGGGTGSGGCVLDAGESRSVLVAREGVANGSGARELGPELGSVSGPALLPSTLGLLFVRDSSTRWSLSRIMERGDDSVGLRQC